MGMKRDDGRLAFELEAFAHLFEAAPQATQGADKSRELAIMAVAATPWQGQPCMLWPSWCALDVKHGQVVGFRRPETFASAEEAAAVRADTASMLHQLLAQLQAVSQQIATLQAELGGSLGD